MGKSKNDSVENSDSDSDEKTDGDKQSKVESITLEKRGKIIFFTIFCLVNIRNLFLYIYVI